MATRTALPLLDAEREQIRENLRALSDQELVGALMTTQKFIQGRSDGWVHDLAERQTVIVTCVLERFAHEAFEAELAEWDSTPEDGWFEIASAQEGLEQAQERLDEAIDKLDDVLGRLRERLSDASDQEHQGEAESDA